MVAEVPDTDWAAPLVDEPIDEAVPGERRSVARIAMDGLQAALLTRRREEISNVGDDVLLMEVRREAVLHDAIVMMRYLPNLHDALQVLFVGEEGVDLGGPRREFWSIFLHQLVHSIYVKGEPGKLTFRRNFVQLKKKTFLYIGKLVALGILQDGPGLPVFADAVVQFLLQDSIKSHSTLDLPSGIQDTLKRMENAGEGELGGIYSEMFDIAAEAGFIVPANQFTKEHIATLKVALVEDLVTSCAEELQQFKEGLKVCQVLSLLQDREHVPAARRLFSGALQPITPAALRRILRFHYAENDNVRRQDMSTAQGFLSFIQATKSDETTYNGVHVATEHVLMWLTGATKVPAVGFHKDVDVYFGDKTFVNTCALTMTLKRQSCLPDEAVQVFTELILNSQTFGQE